MKNKSIYLFSLLVISALVCVFAFGQTISKKEKEASDNSDNETRQISQTSTKPNYEPKDGYVPDEETAIAIAVAVWNPIYGKENIDAEKPFHANLKNGIWTVTGSLPKGFDKGGTAIAEISKEDGRILRIIHEK